MEQSIIAVIPARYDSRRFPGKALAEIAGMSMIERVYRQIEKAERFTDIIVATDDMRIAETVKHFGGQIYMTSTDIQSGTDRVFEVLKGKNARGVINIQGDEPLISETVIARVYDELAKFEHQVVSAYYDNDSLEDFQSRNIVKVVMNNRFQALYFSRSPVPFHRDAVFTGFHQHIGIYGYLKSTLERFVNFPMSDLEKKEKLEQLRFLANGIIIKMVKSNYRSMGVDVPGDVKKIEDELRQENEKN